VFTAFSLPYSTLYLHFRCTNICIGFGVAACPAPRLRTGEAEIFVAGRPYTRGGFWLRRQVLRSERRVRVTHGLRRWAGVVKLSIATEEADEAAVDIGDIFDSVSIFPNLNLLSSSCAIWKRSLNCKSPYLKTPHQIALSLRLGPRCLDIGAQMQPIIKFKPSPFVDKWYARILLKETYKIFNYISILILSSITLIGVDVLRMLISKNGKLFSIFTVD
jgi:hypothetical protein